MFRRGNVFYCQDNFSGRQESLRTSDEKSARRLFAAKNETARQPQLNLALARVYLTGHDTRLVRRTWAEVMEASIQPGLRESSVRRLRRAYQNKAYDRIREKPLVETTPDDLLAAIRAGRNSVNFYLRRLHNHAIGIGWLPWPIIAAKNWPKIRSTSRRAITADEHRRIVETERNFERRLYYELLWQTGASQSDGANLRAEDIDWTSRVLVFHRQKLTPEHPPVTLSIGPRLEELLKTLPSTGPLFPKLNQSKAEWRAAEFNRRCKVLGIEGISLHSYRYAWAERAKVAGMPERFAQVALGHNSKAVHRVYAKKAQVKVPSLEEYESKSREASAVRTAA
jgi:integrase